MKQKERLFPNTVHKKNNNNSNLINNNGKLTNRKSLDKKKKVKIDIYAEIYNNTVENRFPNDNKIHLTKNRKAYKSVKDIIASKKALNTNTKYENSNKIKEYENNLYKSTDFDKEKDYELFDFNKYMKQNKPKIKIIRNIGENRNKLKKQKVLSKSAKSINNYKNENKNKKRKNDDGEDEEDEESSDDDDFKKENDLIYRTLYRATMTIKKDNNDDNNKNNNNNEQSKDKDKYSQNSNRNKISMQKTDNIRYNKDEGRIFTEDNNSYKKNSNKINGLNFPSPSEKKKSGNSTTNKPKSKNKLDMERAIDLYVIDGDDDDIIVSQKYKKDIDLKRNKFIEIKIEKFDSNSKKEKKKLTGFVLTRKSKGKKIYEIELEDNIEKINSVFKNKNIMINNKIIQMIFLENLTKYQNNLNNKLNKEEENIKAEINKDKKIDNEILNLKSKIKELNSIIEQQKLELEKKEEDNIEKMKSLQSEYEQLKLSYQSLEKEKISLLNQIPNSISNTKKIISSQIENNQKNIKEMQERIQKFKDELKKPGHRQSFIGSVDKDKLINKNNQNKIKKKHKNSVEIPITNFDKIEKNMKKNEIIQKKNEINEDDDFDYGLNFKDDGTNKKNKKMRKAVDRFNQKYSNVIKEEKKLKKLKEKEEAEKQKDEIKENIGNEKEKNRISMDLNEIKEKERIEREKKEREEQEKKEIEEKEKKEREEREMREKEEQERREREEQERIEREKREREEAERIEKERREREEAERIEREMKEKEERERREREEQERIEREKKEREEQERKEREERERKEREEAQRIEKERKEREEAERIEKEKKEKEEKERKEKEKKEKEEKEKKDKEKKDKEKKDKPPMTNNKMGGIQNKMMMGGNFAKMLADKLKMAPPGGNKKVGFNGPKRDSKPPVIENTVDVEKLIEQKPFKGRGQKRKPTRKFFVEQNENDN